MTFLTIPMESSIRRTNGSNEIFEYKTQTYGDIIQSIPNTGE